MNFSLISVYARANLEKQVSDTYFGWLWWVVEPLSTMLVYYFVFEVLLSRGGDGYVYFLLVGVVVWTWFSNSVTQAGGSIYREKGVIQTININKIVFPIIAILENMIKQVIVVGILLLILLAMTGFKITWLYLPVLVVEQALIIAGFSIVCAALVPFFPDLSVIITVGLRAAMFCSGVFYTTDMLSESLQKYFLWNPMANLINQYRDVLINGVPPDPVSVLGISLFSVVAMSIGVALVTANNKKYARLVVQ